MRMPIRVGAIIFKEGKLITTKMKKGNIEYYILPGGGVEDYETIEEALKRELMEELNLKVKKFRLVYIRELRNKEIGRIIEFYFFIEEYKGKPKKGFDPEVKESSFEDIIFLELDELNKVTFHPKELINVIKSDKEKGFREIKHLGLYNYP